MLGSLGSREQRDVIHILEVCWQSDASHVEGGVAGTEGRDFHLSHAVAKGQREEKW